MCQPFDELSSNQEEADTKVFLAAKLAQDIGCSNIGIFTVDSDVAILACFYAMKLQSRLLVNIGSGCNVRILDVGNTEWSVDLLNSLPSLHAISGCDAVSAFNGIGKAKWLSTVEKKEEYLCALDNLGESLEVSENLFANIEHLVCHLYGMPNEVDVNNGRYKTFCKSKTPEPHQLPPTKDELLQHVKRANYQSYIWKRAFMVNPDVPSPTGHGWSENDSHLEIVWMENQPAPESLLELVVCNCRRAKCADNCQCRILSMECTDVCKCAGNCENIVYDSDSSESDLDSEDNEEEYEAFE